MQEQILNVQQAAEYLGISPSRVRQLAAEGRIGEKLGLQWMFRKSELEAFAQIPRPVGRPAMEQEETPDA